MNETTASAVEKLPLSTPAIVIVIASASAAANVLRRPSDTTSSRKLRIIRMSITQQRACRRRHTSSKRVKSHNLKDFWLLISINNFSPPAKRKGWRHSAPVHTSTHPGPHQCELRKTRLKWPTSTSTGSFPAVPRNPGQVADMTAFRWC